MRVAMIVTDDRQAWSQLDLVDPFFGNAPEALFQGLGRREDVELHIISCAQRPLGGRVAYGSKVHFHSVYAPKIGWLRTGYSLCIARTRRLLREIQPDMVHGQGTEKDCALDAVFSGFPNVLTIHGNMRAVACRLRARPFSFFWCAALLERLALPRADGIICISRYTKALVEPLHRRTFLVPNAIRQEFLDRGAAGIVPPSQRRRDVLFVGTLNEYKRPDFVVRVCQRLWLEGVDFRLRMFGRGDASSPYCRQLRQMTQSDEKAGRIVYEGHQKDLVAEFSMARLLVSGTAEDNLPLNLMEAMAVGTPVVATDVGGIPDLVDHDVNGFLFPGPVGSWRGASPLRAEGYGPERSVTDAEAIKRCSDFILRLLTDDALVERMGQAGRQKAAAKFSPEVVASQTLEVYRQILSEVRS